MSMHAQASRSPQSVSVPALRMLSLLVWVATGFAALAEKPFLSPEEAVELFNPKAPPIILEEDDADASEQFCACTLAADTPTDFSPVAAVLKVKPSPPQISETTEIKPPKVVAVGKNVSKDGRENRRFKILVLGDSLGLCGFGKFLDARLRGDKHIAAVATYMACGTIPSSWLKIGPYSGARTACGYWSIEGAPGAAPAETRDTYGMARGHKPGSHAVPKIENLIDSFQPDILVMQNGTNLLSLFSDGSTVIPARHDPQIRAQLLPFLNTVCSRSTSLRKIYWVAPPVSGRYSKATQDFLVEKLSSYGAGVWGVIDSRALVSYPYKLPMPDKEHFIGRDMETWAEGVYKTISQDMELGAIPPKNIAEQKITSGPPKNESPASPQNSRTHVELRAKLLHKSPPLRQEQILPYQESLVSHLYQVETVLKGSYSEKEILVMHPAHIRLKPQPLNEYQIGKTYHLDLIELEGSPWESIKKSDASGKLELLPFLRIEDESRYPSNNR